VSPRKRSTKARPARKSGALRIGVDTGGTFTDLVGLDADGLRFGKVPSTPHDPSEAVARGLDELGGEHAQEVVHGTTVALNALLTGRTARVAMVTNQGFRDLIEIGRQEREDIYALHPRKIEPLVPRSRRFEIRQRTWPDGKGGWTETETPTRAELTALTNAVRRSGAESVAVCLLHAYADPKIEAHIERALRPAGIPITTSSSILRSFREFERFSTTIANAALIPVVRDYLQRLERELPELRLSIMQSSGGTLSAAQAALEPVRVLFSGPAGGVIGAGRAAIDAGLGDIVTLDIGGTSADVAFHSPTAGLANTVLETHLAGRPVAVPTLDIHTIGCGGGSRVHVDAGGILHVGPESAGAHPGPVCYGHGDTLTVTDAHVFLGHVAAQGFLGGEFPLDVDAVTRAFEALGKQLGVRPQVAAQGVLDVAHAAIRRAVGVMTMQRGHDPKRLPLVAFGGAGGLAAVAVARSLQMPGALVPAQPGVLSAYGMVAADAIHDETRTILAPLTGWNARERKRALRELGEIGKARLMAAGTAARAVQFEYSLDLRYQGQSFDISVAEGSTPRATFEERHQKLYGWTLPEGEVEIVNLRARASAHTHTHTHADATGAGDSASTGRPRRRPAPKAAVLGERRPWFGERVTATRIDRARLAAGHVVSGPAIIEEYSGTTLVPPGSRAEVTRGGHLWITSA
jgi:N-methylhydantoinase A